MRHHVDTRAPARVQPKLLSLRGRRRELEDLIHRGGSSNLRQIEVYRIEVGRSDRRDLVPFRFSVAFLYSPLHVDDLRIEQLYGWQV